MRNKFIVIGAGKLGHYISNTLSINGKDTIIIDKDKKKIDYMPLTYSGLTVVADATQTKVLEENNINSCKCLIVLTDDDNTNIFIAHLAKVFYEVPNIIIRLSDPNKNSLVETIGIKTISPFVLGIEEIDKQIRKIR